MDTRHKILPVSSLPDLVDGHNWIAVAGVFDPLTLVQAERLSGFAKPAHKLLAVVRPGAPGDLLPAHARAALVASLRSVDAVVVASADDIRAAGFAVREDNRGEQARTADFVHFVLQR